MLADPARRSRERRQIRGFEQKAVTGALPYVGAAAVIV